MSEEGQRIRSSRWSYDHPGSRREACTGQRNLHIGSFHSHKAAGGNRSHHEETMINVAEEMKHLHKLAVENPDKRFGNLWKLITSAEWLTQAWIEIRDNKGSKTPGIDSYTKDDVTLECISRTQEKLRNGTYSPQAVRRVYIPKSNGKLRPLGIPTLEDRIVQQGLRMILEPIFEADFLPCSHGFRQGHSPHTALRDVATMFPRTSWTIEGDIVGCFDNIPHAGLLKAVERRVEDGKILSLVKSFLSAGYMEKREYHRTYSGTPQGGIVSPLLCNIYLHQLDVYMLSLGANKTQSRSDIRLRINPEYKRIENAIQRKQRTLNNLSDKIVKRELEDELKSLRKELRRTPVYSNDNRHKSKLGYARYADDFVILVNGSQEEAIEYKSKVEVFLKGIGLTLSEEKTRITPWDKPIYFLGFAIEGKLRRNGVQIRAILSIPKEKELLIRRELLKVASYFHIPEIDAVIQMNAKFLGWCNYYKYATSPSHVFERLSRKMWWFTAHYLARKHKRSMKSLLTWTSANGMYKKVNGRQTFVIKAGKREVALQGKPPKTAQIRSVTGKGGWEVDLKPLPSNFWLSGRSNATRLTALARSDGMCSRCGENPAQHVHHPNRLGTKTTSLAKIQSDASQREQAEALCKECHLEVHHGSWNSFTWEKIAKDGN